MKTLIRKALKAAMLAPVPLYRKGLSQGVAAANEHRAVVQSLPLTLCIDVGANIGQFSLLIRHLHPDARLIAFEPLKGPAARYRQLFAGDDNTTLHDSAIGEHDESVDMNVSGSIDSSSILAISKKQSELYPGTAKTGSEPVKVARLSCFVDTNELSGPCLLKIDVQGFELPVLRGAASLLQHIDWIYVEASYTTLYEGQALCWEVIEYLHGQSFRLTGVYNTSFDPHGIAVQSDFLFTHVGGAEAR